MQDRKRPYETVVAAPAAAGFTVLIDGRQLRTPARNPFAAPTYALAELCAAEWAAQGDTVRPETMPITRLANVAVDQTPQARWRMAESIAGYAATDLVCHRADAPPALVERQSKAWDPLVEWAGARLEAPLTVVTGVIAAEQPSAARAAFERLALEFDDFGLTGLSHAVGMSGSGVLGFALALKKLTAAEAFEAALLDDLWQLETWGEDFAARERVETMRAEFEQLGRWFAAI